MYKKEENPSLDRFYRLGGKKEALPSEDECDEDFQSTHWAIRRNTEPDIWDGREMELMCLG